MKYEVWFYINNKTYTFIDFILKAKVKVPDKILLVDDVYTTGRTLQHAISVLKQGGAQEIKTFSLCR